MDIMVKRFYEFVKDDKTQGFFAFLLYSLCLLYLAGKNLPLAFQSICNIALMVAQISCLIYIITYDNKLSLKEIGKEILMYMIVILLDIYITPVFISGKSANQASLNKACSQIPIIYFVLLAVIIVPILEEYIFRFLPSKFIKNKVLYIIISAVIFAGMHVINDPKPFYYIWAYMLDSLYFGYRYYKTKNIFVTISLHSFNNLIALIPMFLI